MDDFDDLDLSSDIDEPIILEDLDAASASISRDPLDLGGGKSISPKAKPKPAASPKPPVAQVISQPAAAEKKITGVRTFFTKLHAGALNFLDEQITDWLKKNPDIVIKRTNTVTGEVIGKKVEPNILVTVWYYKD